MMPHELGEIILYQSKNGQATLDVHLKDETVWLTQAQMVDLFQRDKRTISEHIRNVFKEGELVEEAVVRKFRITAADGKSYLTNFYNLDVIISVGYRVKSQCGTQFRIWATCVLKDHIIHGYSLNQQRLTEKGTEEIRQALNLLSHTLENHNLVIEEGLAVLDVINRYARTWHILLEYDENRLQLPAIQHDTHAMLRIEEIRSSITELKKELLRRGEATDLFGQERGHGLSGIVGAVQQSFGGQDLYPSVEEKAAHLLYFVIKDHPFSDGNKRIGSFLFLLFLRRNGLLETGGFENRALVALALLTATSEARQKELIIRLIMNLVTESD